MRRCLCLGRTGQCWRGRGTAAREAADQKGRYMREKYESLSVSVLKELAKARGIKGTSAMKKSQVVEAMLALDEKEKQESGGRAAQEPAKGNKDEKHGERREERDRSAGREERSEAAHHSYRGRHTVYRPAERNAQDTVQEHGGQERTAQDRSGQERSSQDRASQDRSNQERSNQERTSQDRASQDRSSQDRSSQERFSQERSSQEKSSLADSELDSGIAANGILEVLPDGYGFIRCENFMPGENDVYVSPSQIRKFNLKTGDILYGNTRIKTQGEKFSALLYLKSVNDLPPYEATKRWNFEDMTPIFPDERLRLERSQSSIAMRITDLISPIGKGQRGMIVSPPKAGKTTLLKEVAKSILSNNPDIHLMILLIDERPEEVTDIKEAIQGKNVEVIYSTFDELPEHHKRVSEMVIERAKRLVEHRRDVVILLDSITRLARAYNLTVPPSGRTLSGGLDPAALHMPKRFFGSARNMREGGSLTILATALVETGSKMDDVIYEEFKGTGNMELVLDRKLSEKRVFPAIDIPKSGTRREDLLLDPQEQEAVDIMRKALNGMKQDEAVESILNLFARTRNNREFIQIVKKTRLV